MRVRRMGYLSFGNQWPKVDQQHGQKGDPGAENSMLSANQTHQMSALFTEAHYRHSDRNINPLTCPPNFSDHDYLEY